MAIRADVDDMIAFLNNLLSMDRHFLQELMSQRVPCNAAIANHPTVQVFPGSVNDFFIRPGEFRCGLIGLLNGYFGTIDEGPTKGWGPIAAIYDDGKLVGFKRTDFPHTNANE